MAVVVWFADRKGTHMTIYDFTVLFELDTESGGYVVRCPSLPGCYSQGDTIDEAIANIKEAILLCLEDMQEQSIPIPEPAKTLVGSVAVAL